MAGAVLARLHLSCSLMWSRIPSRSGAFAVPSRMRRDATECDSCGMAPRTVMFIRHAEKPGDSGLPLGVDQHGQSDPHSLSVQGWTRAGALAALFDHVPTPERPGVARPQRVLATKPTHEYKSKRERDTATPTAARLGIGVEDELSHGDTEEAAASILGDDRDALVVWHHGSIPLLVEQFPLADPTALPKTWPEDRFDLIWCLNRTPNGDYEFSSAAQDLLADDAPLPSRERRET
jgi:hypothetical protein